MQLKYAFEFLDVELRPGKPRTTGLTLVRDRMRGLQEQQQFLETYSQFVDYAKISNFAPRLYSESFLRSKLALYIEHDVTPFFGGILFENAVVQKKTEQLSAYLLEMGAPAIELSNTIYGLSTIEMQKHVNTFANNGLLVFVEWGKSYPNSPMEPLTAASQVSEWIDAGASFAILERAEIDLLLSDSGPDDGPQRLSRLRELVGGQRLIFEVEFVPQMVTLLKHLGRDVNLGPNIDYEIIRWLEPSRLGISREMGHSTIEQAVKRISQIS